jgi:hypothetical protein
MVASLSRFVFGRNQTRSYDRGAIRFFALGNSLGWIIPNSQRIFHFISTLNNNRCGWAAVKRVATDEKLGDESHRQEVVSSGQSRHNRKQGRESFVFYLRLSSWSIKQVIVVDT